MYEIGFRDGIFSVLFDEHAARVNVPSDEIVRHQNGHGTLFEHRPRPADIHFDIALGFHLFRAEPNFGHFLGRKKAAHQRERLCLPRQKFPARKGGNIVPAAF